jgi:carbonic anhydrase/acetyltransferase-like protein (isoleucine patch superfamily)
VLLARNGTAPAIHSDARVSAAATIVGNVKIGRRAFIDHGAVIESSGPPVEIADEVVVFAGAIIRSVGGAHRPAYPVRVGRRSLVSPLSVLTGCEVGEHCYLATATVLLQGARLGNHVRVGAGAIVHAKTVIPDESRVGMRHIAVPTANGFLSTADIEQARDVLTATDFFETAFGIAHTDQSTLHREVMSTLLAEVGDWRDEVMT